MPSSGHRSETGMTDYERTLSWLYTLEAAKGMDFKLERVALALKQLGDPQRSFKALHIAGTNGKGSVAAMMVPSTMLITASAAAQASGDPA